VLRLTGELRRLSAQQPSRYLIRPTRTIDDAQPSAGRCEPNAQRPSLEEVEAERSVGDQAPSRLVVLIVHDLRHHIVGVGTSDLEVDAALSGTDSSAIAASSSGAATPRGRSKWCPA
jgi:hypothetical protein